MFHQMTNQTNYVKQTTTELKKDCDQMRSQREDFYDPNAIQPEYLDKLGMRYSKDKDCDPYKQEHYR